MKNVLAVHLEKAECDLVERILAEVFRVIIVIFIDNVGEGATVHVFEQDGDILLVIIQVDTLDHLITVQEGDQTSLVDDVLSLLLRRVRDHLQCELFTIRLSFNEIDLSKGALTDIF